MNFVFEVVRFGRPDAVTVCVVLLALRAIRLVTSTGAFNALVAKSNPG
jgi:hypothetical protein